MYLVVEFPVVPWQRLGLVSRGGFGNGHFSVVREWEVRVVQAGEKVVLVTLLLVHVVIHQPGKGWILTLVDPELSILHLNDAVHDPFYRDKSQNIGGFAISSSISFGSEHTKCYNYIN